MILRPSRRMFLTGATATLAIPFLSSLLPRTSWAAPVVPKLRYVQLTTNTGFWSPSYFPKSDGMQDLGGGVKGKLLSSVQGPMSVIMSSALDPFRRKMTLIKGLDCASGENNGNHQCSVPGSASAPTPAQDGTAGSTGSTGSFPFSVDAVIAASAKVYPSPPQRRLVHTSTGSIYYSNWSFTDAGRSTLIPGPWADYTKYNPGAVDSLLAYFNWPTTGPKPTVDPMLAVKAAVLNDVHGDYKAVRDSSRISASDKARLDAYMSLINDVGSGLSSTAGAACHPVTGHEDADVYKDQISILVAALACGLTNVAMYSLPVSGGGNDTMHDAAHAMDGKSDPVHGPTMASKVTPYVAYFLQQLDALIDDGGATLLDNSIFYFANEFGSLAPFSAHVTSGMCAMVAGSAGGRLKPGYFLDYTNASSPLLYNNLLVTFLNAMGLSSSDYERKGIAGFGGYRGTNADLLTTAQRRQPLPFFYTGSARG